MNSPIFSFLLLSLAFTPSPLRAENHPRAEPANAFSSDTSIDERLRTTAEHTAWKDTGRYEEVTSLCPAFAQAFPDKVRCFSFGVTPEGRSMLALAISGDGTLDAAGARAKKRPVVLFQGGIHAGEIDGKDAGFAFVRELLTGKPSDLDPDEKPADFSRRSQEILKSTVLVFVPVFNIDGHERFGRWNRPNQVGPAEMGWRTTAQNLNLNRDYAKVETPEMAAMLKLLGEWDPLVYIDLHVTDGAQFQHDIAVMVNPSDVGPKSLAKEGKELRKETMKYLASRGSRPLDFYPEFLKDDLPSSGFERSFSPPRFSDSYWAYRNRFGVLVETHSWKDYRTRCKSTLDTLRVLADGAARNGERWFAAAHSAEEAGNHRAGKDTPLSWEHAGKPEMIDFLGYQYERKVSPVSGRAETHYDSSKPELWQVPLYEELVPKLVVKAPLAGYIVPAAYAAQIGAKLALHAIQFQKLLLPHPSLELEAYRATTTKFAAEPFEGRQGLELKGAWLPEKRAVPAGSLFVPIDQPRSELTMELLEPEAPDSFAAWGFFNSAFERKEYMENYVADSVGIDMLAQDPAVRAEFQHRLDTDAEFAKSPEKRLEFFYRRHRSWDERYDLYPVFRVAKPVRETASAAGE